MPELSAIVPVFNEAPHLAASLATIAAALERATSDYELIVVDDGSTDDSWQAIAAMHSADPRVRGFRLARNYGKDSAIAAGLEHCRGRAAVVIDSDLQHPAELIPEFHRIWKEEGAALVQGIKMPGTSEPVLRRLASRAFNWAATRLTGIPFGRSTDFKLLDRSVIEAWIRMPESRLFFRGMVGWLGYPSRTVEFAVRPRASGRSRFGLSGLVASAWRAISAYSYLPLRIIHLFAILFLAFSFLLGAWALYLWATGRAVTGFTTVILLQLVIGGLTLLSLAMIAEYVAAVYEETKRRPRYVVSETLERVLAADKRR